MAKNGLLFFELFIIEVPNIPKYYRPMLVITL